MDDDPDDTVKLKTILYGIGFRVNSFNDPILALQNFHAGSYDLLIIDINMPHISGFDLYEKIREIDNKVKIRFLITESEINLEKKFHLPNLNCFIKKPIENEKLIIKQVTEIIGQSE